MYEKKKNLLKRIQNLQSILWYKVIHKQTDYLVVCLPPDNPSACVTASPKEFQICRQPLKVYSNVALKVCVSQIYKGRRQVMSLCVSYLFTLKPQAFL